MRSFWPIYKRELFAFFVTPLAWVLIVVFLLTQGMHFFLLVDEFSRSGADAFGDETPLTAFFGNTVLLYMVLFVLVPPMTMRLFAEERRSGTIETLMTAPVSSAAVVLAKYAAVLTTYLAMWAPTLLYVVVLRHTGAVDWHTVGSSYFGLFGIGAAYLALGTLMSSLSKSQLVALLLAIFAEFGLFVLGVGEYVFEPGLLRDISAHVSMASQMEEMSRGIIDLRRVVFDGSVAAASLFITGRVVDSWRWG